MLTLRVKKNTYAAGIWKPISIVDLAAPISPELYEAAVRMRQVSANALALATHLQKAPAVTAVIYPGLPDHPGHAIARRQQQGFGAMVSFELRGAVSGDLSPKALSERLQSLEAEVALLGLPWAEEDPRLQALRQQGLHIRRLKLQVE